jgi:polyribonucleotide nucleotidyltransferase
MAFLNDQWQINPSYEQQDQAEIALTFSAVEGNQEILINMIEAAGKESEESQIIEGLNKAEPV